ncbi:conjugal transfer protein TraF [Sphingomonas sp. LH128]|nr:conjugal transfer protein TraF [Sphingomonas sp. LH128]
MVVARLAPAWEDFAAARRYLAAHVPLVKRVAAGPGDRVCAQGGKIFRNGVFLAGRLGRDRAGRTMPWWNGCLRLQSGQFLLLMADNPASFDGRYFGITSQQYVIGRARLLWAR